MDIELDKGKRFLYLSKSFIEKWKDALIRGAERFPEAVPEVVAEIAPTPEPVIETFVDIPPPSPDNPAQTQASPQ